MQSVQVDFGCLFQGLSLSRLCPANMQTTSPIRTAARCRTPVPFASLPQCEKCWDMLGCSPSPSCELSIHPRQLYAQLAEVINVHCFSDSLWLCMSKQSSAFCECKLFCGGACVAIVLMNWMPHDASMTRRLPDNSPCTHGSGLSKCLNNEAS